MTAPILDLLLTCRPPLKRLGGAGRLLAHLCLALALLITVACGTPSVMRAISAPPEPPQPGLKAGICVTTHATSPTSEAMLRLPLTPRSAKIFWLPNQRQRPCRTELTVLGQNDAAQLALLVYDSPKAGGGTSACPSGGSAVVEMYFV